MNFLRAKRPAVPAENCDISDGVLSNFGFGIKAGRPFEILIDLLKCTCT